jgi:hypothetical protein
LIGDNIPCESPATPDSNVIDSNTSTSGRKRIVLLMASPSLSDTGSQNNVDFINLRDVHHDFKQILPLFGQKEEFSSRLHARLDALITPGLAGLGAGRVTMRKFLDNRH